LSSNIFDPVVGAGAPALPPKAERACPEAGSFLPICRSLSSDHLTLRIFYD